MDQVLSNNARWLWLAVLTSFAIFTLSSGKLLLGSGLLLLGVFAFFNNPLARAPTQMAKASILIKISWTCGALGVIAVLAAAVATWL